MVAATTIVVRRRTTADTGDAGRPPIGPLLRTGWRALLVALLSWTLVATLAWAAVQLA